MTPLSDLIAKLEAAKEGSREIDRAIAFAVNWRGFQNEDKIYLENADDIPNFTTSLDAALTLVPEGYKPDSLDWYSHPTMNRVWFTRGEGLDLMAEGTTPVLALCIAALKAREARR